MEAEDFVKERIPGAKAEPPVPDHPLEEELNWIIRDGEVSRV